MNVPALTLPSSSTTPCIPHLSHHSPCTSSTTSTINHAQTHNQSGQKNQQSFPLPQPSQHRQFGSPLDLLSHVALSQYPLPSIKQPSGDTTPPPTHTPSSSLYASPTTPHNPHPLPSIRLAQYHSNYLSHSQSQTQSHSNSATTTTPTPSPSSVLYHADYSPLSCDDATTSTSRLSPHLPPPITKAMHTLKNHRIHRQTRSQPSRFCHICSRTSKKVGLMPCANFETGMCRKVICQKCFNEYVIIPFSCFFSTLLYTMHAFLNSDLVDVPNFYYLFYVLTVTTGIGRLHTSPLLPGGARIVERCAPNVHNARFIDGQMNVDVSNNSNIVHTEHRL